MTGVPWSRSCQNCKIKKIKCDRNWPTCSQCVRSRKPCPGPSTHTKFVHYSQNDPKDLDASGFSGGEDAGAQDQSENGQQKTIMTSYGDSKRYGDEGASLAVFRLHVPRANLTTSAERVGARLVNLWERHGTEGIRLQNSFLQYLPPRLSRSACLRDCAALFCSAWNEYRRGKPVETLLETPLYGKALRSLQSAFQGDQVYTVETLGAMVLLERSCVMFGPKSSSNPNNHHRAIEWVLTNKPPLNLDDELEVALAFENASILQTSSLKGETKNYVTEDRWRELLKKVTQDSMDRDDENILSGSDDERQSFSINSLETMIESARCASRIYANPLGQEDLKETISRDMRAISARIDLMCVECKTRSFKMGSLREVPDPDSITGFRFECSTVKFAQVYAGIIRMQLSLTRMIYDLEVVYGSPAEAEYDRYRATCAEMWNFVPYLSTVDAISALHIIGAIFPSIEGANDAELDYIIEALYKADEYQKRLPRDRKLLLAKCIGVAKSGTGRI